MANDFSAIPWVIDTPGFASIKQQIKINSISIVDAAVVGDVCLIQDQNGKTIVDTKSEGPNKVQSFGIGSWVRGLQVPTLDSGKILVYID